MESALRTVKSSQKINRTTRSVRRWNQSRTKKNKLGIKWEIKLSPRGSISERIKNKEIAVKKQWTWK